MLIPSSFKLAGLTIDVIQDDQLVSKKGIVGEANYAGQSIRLDTSITQKESVEQSYLHELTHWIFFILNEDELRNNEKLVDTFAHLLHQALTTAKYEDTDAI